MTNQKIDAIEPKSPTDNDKQNHTLTDQDRRASGATGQPTSTGESGNTDPNGISPEIGVEERDSTSDKVNNTNHNDASQIITISADLPSVSAVIISNHLKICDSTKDFASAQSQSQSLVERKMT